MELRNVKLEAMIIFEGSTALKADDKVRRKPHSSPVDAKSNSPQAFSEGAYCTALRRQRIHIRWQLLQQRHSTNKHIVQTSCTTAVQVQWMQTIPHQFPLLLCHVASLRVRGHPSGTPQSCSMKPQLLQKLKGQYRYVNVSSPCTSTRSNVQVCHAQRIITKLRGSYICGVRAAGKQTNTHSSNQ